MNVRLSKIYLKFIKKSLILPHKKLSNLGSNHIQAIQPEPGRQPSRATLNIFLNCSFNIPATIPTFSHIVNMLQCKNY